LKTLALAAAAVSITACGPPEGPAAPTHQTTEMVATPSPEPPPVARAAGPFKAVAIALRDRPDAVAVTKLASGGIAARFGNAGAMLIVRGRGGTLLMPGARARKLPARHFVRSRFSPDDAHLAVVDEKKKLTVVRTADARVIAEVSNADRPRWIGADRLVARRGCTALEIDLKGRQTPRGRVPGPCDDVLESSRDQTTWVVADRGRYRRGSQYTYRRLDRVVLATGATEGVFVGTDDTHVMSPAVSPDLGRVCWLDNQLEVYCRLGDAKPERIWGQAELPLAFSADGRRLLFAEGKHTDPSSRVGVVDFEARTISFVPRAGRQWWLFLPGGRRIAGHGGSSSAAVYDLEAGWRADVGDTRSEWEGLWPTPTGDARFAVGRERGGTRDIYTVTINE
jgi:hypothetical protein